MNFCFLKSFHFSYRKTPTSWKYPTVCQSFFLVFFCSLSLLTLAQASELQIELGDSWVEDGYIFHIDVQLLPYNDYCPTTGRGFIPHILNLDKNTQFVHVTKKIFTLRMERDK